MSWAYYNEHDPKKAAWLRELMAVGEIMEGDVDERPIQSVCAGDVRGYTRCHFFAGIGVWDYALRLAGWPDDEPVWTGSCPCPSFSSAGKGEGLDDPRHLWPDWYRLIRESAPPVVFGEQADDAIGFGWLDLVHSDLEAEEYAVGAAVLGACSVGAPHRRQRLYFGAVGESTSRRCTAGRAGEAVFGWQARGTVERPGAFGGMEYAGGEGLAGWPSQRRDDGAQFAAVERAGGCSPWNDAVWIPCEIDKHGRRLYRATQSVPESLADGTADLLGSVRYQGGLGSVRYQGGRIFHPLQVKAPARRLRLHGYGDAIVAQVAAEFIRCFMEER